MQKQVEMLGEAWIRAICPEIDLRMLQQYCFDNPPVRRGAAPRKVWRRQRRQVCEANAWGLVQAADERRSTLRSCSPGAHRKAVNDIGQEGVDVEESDEECTDVSSTDSEDDLRGGTATLPEEADEVTDSGGDANPETLTRVPKIKAVMEILELKADFQFA